MRTSFRKCPRTLIHWTVQYFTKLTTLQQRGAIDRVAWKMQSTEERCDVMLRQGKAHERRDAEAKHLTEQRDAEQDKARHMREQEQRDTLRQRKSGVMLRQSNAHERARTVTRQLRHMRESKNGVKDAETKHTRKQY